MPVIHVSSHESGPEFLYVGAARSGSSWFSEVLREHPAVFIPPNRATFYFTVHYGMGASWYEEFFLGKSQGRVAGEVCHDYLMESDALIRIKEYRPEMRLICCFRNPYERAISAWNFYKRHGLDQATLVAQASRNKDLFVQGNYATQLRFAQALFPANQIFVLFYDDIARNPRGVARAVYEFIGVDPNFIPPSISARINVSTMPRSRALARLVYDVHRWTWGRSHILSNAVGQVKRIRPVRRLVNRAIYGGEITIKDWREYLSEFPADVVNRYEWEIRDLETLTNRDLRHWSASSVSDRVAVNAFESL